MNSDQITGLMLITFGAYSAIRFRYNGKASLASRKKIARILTFGKAGKTTSEGEIRYAQFMYLIGGIFFIIVGLSKLLSN